MKLKQTNKGKWLVEWTDGKRHRHTFNTQAEAARFMADKLEGNVYKPVTFRKIRTLYNDYLNKEDAAQGTFKQFESGCKLYLQKFGDTVVTTEQARSFRADVGSSTFGTVRAAFGHAMRQGLLANNPLAIGGEYGRLERQRQKGKPRILTDWELNRLSNTGTTLSSSYAIIALATGARVSEILNIRTFDVFLNGVRIFEGKGKKKYDKRSRFIPLHRDDCSFVAQAVEKLRLWNATYPQIRAVLKSWFENIDITDIKQPTHIFRHTAATRWLEEGVSLAEVSRRLGHKNITTTARYLHVTEKELDNKAEAV